MIPIHRINVGDRVVYGGNILEVTRIYPPQTPARPPTASASRTATACGDSPSNDTGTTPSSGTNQTPNST